MTTETSAIHAWLNAFADALSARAVIATGKVLVTTGYVSDVGRRDSIQLGDLIEGEQDWGLIGNRRRDEKFRIKGIIWVTRPGKGETVIRAARAQAFALLAEIEDELRVRPTVSATNKLSALTRYDAEQGASTGGRWIEIDFEVSNWKLLPS